MTTRITVNVAKSDHDKGALHTHNRRGELEERGCER